MTDTIVELSPPPEGTLMPRMRIMREWIAGSCPGRVESWCEFNQGQQSYGMHGYSRELTVRCIKFRFERVQDAVLFKLTYGGKHD